MEANNMPDRPNMVFVLADDLDYTSAQKMPNRLSLLAEEGAAFGNAFMRYPVRVLPLHGQHSHRPVLPQPQHKGPSWAE